MKKRYIKFIAIIAIIILILIIIFVFKLSNPKIDVCEPVISIPAFLINTSTGECDFFPGSGCLNEKTFEGYNGKCNPTLEEQAEILKKTNYWNENISWYDKLTENCTRYCEEKKIAFFCYSENNSKNFCEELEAYG